VGVSHSCLMARGASTVPRASRIYPPVAMGPININNHALSEEPRAAFLLTN